MKCPACGAHNGASAGWCGQCYQSLAAPPPPAAPPTAAPSADPVASTDPAAPSQAPGHGSPVLAGSVAPPTTADTVAIADSPPAVAAPGLDAREAHVGGSRFRQGSAGMEWACSLCQGWSSMDAQACATCQTPFVRSLAGPEQPEAAPEVPEGTALAATALLPGAGHWLVDRKGTAIMRGMVYLLFLIGGMMLFRAASNGLARLPGTFMLLGALTVLGASMFDVREAHARRSRELLSSRNMMWLVLAVLGLTAVGLTLTAFAVTAS